MSSRRLVLPLSDEAEVLAALRDKVDGDPDRSRARRLFGELRIATRLDRDEDVVATALFHLAMHYGLDVHHDVFAISGAKRKQKSA